MRDVATSTTRLALFQSTRSRTNRVWHWRTLRRCRRGMIRMIQAAAHPRTPASIPLLPRPTRTRPGTRLQTLRLPSPRTRTNRTRILRPSERVSQLQAAGGGGGRRAAGVPHGCGPGCRGRAEIAESAGQRSYACGFHHPPHLSWYCRISTCRRRRIICERPCTIPLLHLRIAHAIVPSTAG